MRRLALLAAASLATAPGVAAEPGYVEHRIGPSLADPRVKRFDEPSIAIARTDLPADAPLVVFMPGTGGKPDNTRIMLATIAGQGYRVLGLEYDDTPPGTAICPNDPDPGCQALFREMRSYGTGGFAKVTNPVAEAIVPRLVMALKALAAAAPGEGWGGYLDGDRPRWERIVLSGLSQGAGMAAYIAKDHAVRRVVLFSSPWDETGRDRHPSPWLFRPSATPMDRWYASYNAREKTVPLIRAAYAALAIPPANVRVFALDLPAGVREGPENPNPYHGITIRDPRYAGQWRAMFGQAGLGQAGLGQAGPGQVGLGRPGDPRP